MGMMKIKKYLKIYNLLDVTSLIIFPLSEHCTRKLKNRERPKITNACYLE